MAEPVKKTTIAITQDTMLLIKNLRSEMKLANPGLSIRKDLTCGQIVEYALQKAIGA